MKSRWTSRILFIAVAAALISACGSDSSSSGGSSSGGGGGSTTITALPLEDNAATEGDTITIFGTGFLANDPDNVSDVQIGGISQDFIVVSDTEIIVDKGETSRDASGQGPGGRLHGVGCRRGAEYGRKCQRTVATTIIATSIATSRNQEGSCCQCKKPIALRVTSVRHLLLLWSENNS